MSDPTQLAAEAAQAEVGSNWKNYSWRKARIQSAIEKAVKERDEWWQSDGPMAQLTSRAAHASDPWREWRELLRDGHRRALCWNCGYPELIGSDDCRNCATNFHSKRIEIAAQASKP